MKLSFGATQLAAVLSLLIFSAPAGHASQLVPLVSDKSAEENFKSQMGLENYQLIEYKDVKGARISFSEFQKLRADFPRFTMQKRKIDDQATAVFTLQSADYKPAVPQYKVKPGSAFPTFELRATDDSMVDNEALLGKYTLVSFYFAECLPCIKEVPILNAFADSRNDFSVLAVTFDSTEDTRAFAKKTGFGWRTIANGKELINKAGVKAYPTMALVDPKGVLLAIGTPAGIGVQAGALEKWVDKAMASQAQ